MDLFDYQKTNAKAKTAPLADRMRPRSLDEYVGQAGVVGPASPLRQLIEHDEVPSLILWGPPGTGKTTLARLVARLTAARFVALSAVSSGVAELRAAIAEAQEFGKLHGARTILFVDEIHRWNKAQQDAALPYVEDGTVTLIGATTENPSFEVNAALLSRARVVVLERLGRADLVRLMERALADGERGFGREAIEAEPGALAMIADVADGDARAALNLLELAVRAAARAAGTAAESGDSPAPPVLNLTREGVGLTVSRSHLLYDKDGEEHYNLISALHKSLRGSDADAALYWLGRMLAAGEPPLYVARRLVRFASEDVGLADPFALTHAMAAYQAAHALGRPEADVCLAQCAAYLARAPKSIAVYAAFGEVMRDVAETANDPVPLHLRNAPTKLMKGLGYGAGYVYPPTAAPEAAGAQSYLPPKLAGRRYLDPKEQGKH
jgi:putative ATPase